MYVGGLGLTFVMLAFDHSLPAWLLIPLAMLGAAVFGALWAFIPGYLQARRGSHVVVTTIMFNFIAASLMNFVIVKYLVPEGEQNPASRPFADAAAMPLLSKWFMHADGTSLLGDAPLNVTFLVAIAALVIYGVVVWRSSFGYKMRATGLNQHAAHYAGVSISRMIIVTMLISGALAGLGAVNSVMGSTHYLSLNFPAGAGFVGIAIALMGRQNPVGIFLSSVLFGALIQGGFDLSLEKPNIPQETFIFIQGLIILFCGAMENLYAPAVLKLINLTRSKG
jgi:simple sugar transport system permease protein